MLKKVYQDGMSVSDVCEPLRRIGFNEHEIELVENILVEENITLKALLRQALNEWQGIEKVNFPPHSIID